jgi:hypothetical protein
MHMHWLCGACMHTSKDAVPNRDAEMGAQLFNICNNGPRVVVVQGLDGVHAGIRLRPAAAPLVEHNYLVELGVEEPVRSRGASPACRHGTDSRQQTADSRQTHVSKDASTCSSVCVRCVCVQRAQPLPLPLGYHYHYMQHFKHDMI